MSRTSFIAAIFIIMALPASAQDDDWLAYGRTLVETNCAGCHAVGTTDESSHAEAPPLRTLVDRYPLDALEEAFVEGISTGHPDMPEFVATTEQIGAILDYIDSLASN